MTATDPDSPHRIAATDGRYVHFEALGTRYVVSREQTGGAYAVVEHDLAPRQLGAPTHTHEREDEVSHVLSGRLGVQIGDEIVEAGPGDTVVKPRGVPHAFWNPGDEPVRFLEVISPGGFEDYFAEIEAPLNQMPPPTSRRWARRWPATDSTWTWSRSTGWSPSTASTPHRRRRPSSRRSACTRRGARPRCCRCGQRRTRPSRRFAG